MQDKVENLLYLPFHDCTEVFNSPLFVRANFVIIFKYSTPVFVSNDDTMHFSYYCQGYEIVSYYHIRKNFDTERKLHAFVS